MVICYVTLLLLSLIQPVSQPSPSGQPLPSPKTQLESYFRTDKASDRTRAAAEIGENYRFENVLVELPRLELWSAQKNEPAPPKSGEWKIALPSGQSANALFVLPPDYEPSKPVPLVVVFEKSNEVARVAPEAQIGAAASHAWVTLDESVGGSFHQPISASGDLRAVFREIRRHIHVDVDRIILLGENGGADAAWITAIMNPNQFAGVVAISGIPRIPYPEQSYALLLPNLRGTPFLSIWTDDAAGRPASSVPAVNKAIADFALAAGLPFETATLAHNPSGITPIPQNVIATAISKARQPQSQVEMWFRYLPQGNAGWLRATNIAGDVWDDEQISIAVTTSADRDEFVTETIKQKLFYISGHIDGQTITIDTKRIAAVELRLSPAQVDLSKPVTIFINGRNRFEGVLEPSIKDLLESAYEDWDFQHPAHVRKTFSINAK